jgi:hypothetical protein
LKPGFFKNAELADAGPHAQLLFAGLWLMADKEGRLKDQPRVIKAEVFPYYDVEINGELTVLVRLGHIHRYVACGIAVIEVVNFKRHQSPHHTEKASELPPCSERSAENSSVHEMHSGTTVTSPLENAGNPSDSLIPERNKSRDSERDDLSARRASGKPSQTAESDKPNPRKALFDLGKQVLGSTAGGLISAAIKRKGEEEVAKVIGAMSVSAYADPRAYFVKATQSGHDRVII